jgi:DNA-directed RNA polymerase alpha subunit
MDEFLNGIHEANLRLPFDDRGFSHQTIQALVDCSIDAPERLLFMTEKQIRKIPGISKTSMTEIKAYRERFIR